MFPIYIFILIRPFISEFAFPGIDFVYSILFLIFSFIYLIFNRKKISLKQIPVFSLIFFLTVFLSIFTSQNPFISSKEIYKYLCFLAIFIIAASLKTPQKERISLILIISGLLVSLLSLYHYFFSFPRLISYFSKELSYPFGVEFLSRQRTFVPFFSPDMLAGYLIMIIPLCLALYLQKRKNLFLGLGLFSIFIILSLCFFLTQSIGALLSICISFSIVFFYFQRKTSSNFLFFPLIGFCIIFLCGYINQAPSIFEKSFLDRINYWKETLFIIKDHPFLGVGIGNFYLANTYFAHNSYLQIWVETGILGIISFLGFIICLFKVGFKKLNIEKNYLFAGILCGNLSFIFHNIIDFSFFIPEVSFFWWLTVGLILNFSKSNL